MSSRGVPPPTITPGTSHLLFFGSNIFTLNLVCEVVRLAREQRNDSREIYLSFHIYTHLEGSDIGPKWAVSLQ